MAKLCADTLNNRVVVNMLFFHLTSVALVRWYLGEHIKTYDVPRTTPTKRRSNNMRISMENISELPLNCTFLNCGWASRHQRGKLTCASM